MLIIIKKLVLIKGPGESVNTSLPKRQMFLNKANFKIFNKNLKFIVMINKLHSVANEKITAQTSWRLFASHLMSAYSHWLASK